MDLCICECVLGTASVAVNVARRCRVSKNKLSFNSINHTTDTVFSMLNMLQCVSRSFFVFRLFFRLWKKNVNENKSQNGKCVVLLRIIVFTKLIELYTVYTKYIYCFPFYRLYP